jgi:hypothetical protein
MGYLTRVLLSNLAHSLLPFPDTLPCFINCDGSRSLVYIMRVRSGWQKSYSSKMIDRLGSNPNQFAGLNAKAKSKECSLASLASPINHKINFSCRRGIGSKQSGDRKDCYNR